MKPSGYVFVAFYRVDHVVVEIFWVGAGEADFAKKVQKMWKSLEIIVVGVKKCF